MAFFFIQPVAHGANYIKVVSSCKVTPNRQRIMSQLPNKNLKIYLPFCHIQLPYFLPVTVDRFSARAGHINIVFTIFEPFARSVGWFDREKCLWDPGANLRKLTAAVGQQLSSIRLKVLIWKKDFESDMQQKSASDGWSNTSISIGFWRIDLLL